MTENFDFAGLAQHILSNSHNIVVELLPGGKLVGSEWTCGNLRGTQGTSCKVNINTGRWCDFATDERGNDLISLYAVVNGISQGEAYATLSKEYNFSVERREPDAAVSPHPPKVAKAPSFKHYKHGEPSAVWPYRDANGKELFYIARYDTEDGKQFTPWTLIDGQWKCKAYPDPRPLYNLDKLISDPNKPVLICEGEKSADAAEKLTDGQYVCTTWPNGSKASHKADWSPLKGRNVLIWPDADEAGIKVSDNIINNIYGRCKTLKTIDVSDRPERWDAADALNDGWGWDQLKEWAVPRATIINMNKTEITNVAVSVNTEEQPSGVSGSMFALWESLGVPQNSNGAPIINIDACVRIITGLTDLKNLVWLDEFYQRIFTRWKTDTFREWVDIDNLTLCLQFQREYGLQRMSDKIIYDAIRVIAHNNKRNEPKDYIESLEWDQIPRIRRFFTDYYGADDSEYTLAASKNWWVSMVARIFSPGCQMDNMVILKGPQGRFKSSSLRIIGGKWYTAGGDSVLSKDFYQNLQGKLIIEIGELDSFARSEVNTIKRVVSNPTDRYRKPYDRLPDDHPRQCVFVGTTNEDLILKDHTGGRRFWPIEISDIKLDKIKDDRDQLFAESLHLYKAGEKWYEMPIDETLLVQEENRDFDEWEQHIYDYLLGKTRVTISDIAEGCLKIGLDKMDRRIQMRVARCLTSLGWERKTDRVDGKPRKVWISKDHQYSDDKIEWED